MITHATVPAGHGPAVELEPQAAQSSQDATLGKEILSAIKGVNKEDSSEDQNDILRATRSTYEDVAGMQRMGKDQQLVRSFRLLSMISFTGIATAAWEIGLFQLTPGLVDGG